jgi:hypothetical protein
VMEGKKVAKGVLSTRSRIPIKAGGRGGGKSVNLSLSSCSEV